MEKSSSKTSIAEIETKEDEDSDKSEKKSSKKLSNALNKFLGRKTDEVPNKPNKTILPTKSTSAAIIAEKTKKPPRFRTKKFSKSHENLNKKIEDDVEEDDRDVRAKSVVPKAENSDDVTLESATKDICSHLSQIEINITSRIGNMSPSIVTSPSTLNPIQPTSSSSLITSYGLSPALASKRGSAIHQSVAGKLSPAYRSDEESSERKKSYVESSEDGSITPSESMASGLEDIKELEDESVMDRITRKSYYTRFNEMKRKPKSKRIDSRETMDQQLAAAKARLMQEDQTNMKNVRESLSPSRMTPQRSLTTTSPPPAWDGVIRRNSKTNLGPRTTSLPPEDGMLLYGGGMRSPSVHSPPLDDSGRSMRHQSIEREDQHNYYRAPSVPREDTIQYRRQPSINLDDPLNYKRLSSTGREDPSFYLRQPSVPRDEQPPNYRLPSTVKDETPSYRRLSSAMRDDSSAFRRSSLAKEETQNYRRLSSSHFEDKPNDIRLSSVPRDDIAYKRLSSANRDENLGYRTLQYRKSSALSDEPSFNRYTSPYSRDSQEWKSLRDDSTPKSPSLSPSITLNQRSREGVDNSTTENYDRPEVLAVASAAGKAAGAVAAAAASTENSCDASKRIQSPTTIKTTPESAAVVSAREELTRRLTPLTRLSNMGSGDSSSARPYRRTVTSGNLPIGQNELNKIPTVERPTYRRTSTMGLPPTDSSSRTTDYRRILQDPTRRFTGLSSTKWQ